MKKSANKENCPSEVKLLAFFENRLAYFDRRQIKRHLTSCSDCCDSIAFLVKNFSAEPNAEDARAYELDSGALRAQTANIVALIERIDRTEAVVKPGRLPVFARIQQFLLSTRGLVSTAAIVLVALISVGVITNLYPSSRANEALKTLELARQNGRKISPQTTSLSYAENRTRRSGEQSADDKMFDIALSKISDDGSIPSKSEDRLVMVKILLERAKRGDADRALEIINGELKRGEGSGELLNLKGIALYQIGTHDIATTREAISAYSSAIDKQPNLLAAYFNRALAEERLKLVAEAKQDLERYLAEEKDAGWRKEAREELANLDK